MQYPAKIVKYPYYYFLDIGGTIIIETVYDPVKKKFRRTDNYNYYNQAKRKKLEAKRLKLGSRKNSNCCIF